MDWPREMYTVQRLQAVRQDITFKRSLAIRAIEVGVLGWADGRARCCTCMEWQYKYIQCLVWGAVA